MIGNAREWAMARNLVRRNAVHKAEEFRVPTNSSFSFSDITRHESEQRGSFEMEDPHGSLLDWNLSAETAMEKLVE